MGRAARGQCLINARRTSAPLLQPSSITMALPAQMELDAAEDVFLQDQLGPTIAEHATKCSELFKEAITKPDIPHPTLLDDQLARFRLWTSNMEVFGSPNVSLDYRLRYSPTVVDIIHQLLEVVYKSLVSLAEDTTMKQRADEPPQTPTAKKRRISEAGNVFITKVFPDDDSSDSDSDRDPAEKAASLIIYTIGGTITRLFRLSNAIRKSATASRTRKIEEYKDNEEANTAINELHVYTDSYIRFRFPETTDNLRSALIEANARRLRRFYYQMSHRRRIALTVQNPQMDVKDVQLPKPQTRSPAVRFVPTAPSKSKMTGTNPQSKTNLPPAPVTYATTARQTAVGALYAGSNVEVPRAKSVMVNSRLSFPPVPPTNECPYCGVIVEFSGASKTTMWNDHVMRDLEPFVCFFAHCTDSSRQDHGLLTFETSKSWINHMQSAHGYAWECRAPSHNPIMFEQEAEFQEHSRKEHGVPDAHISTLSSAARRPTTENIRECPFGDEFSAPENAKPTAIFTNDALHLHVAAHMKEIALLVLQKLPSEENEEAEDVASDAPLAEEGVAKLRGSMYSLIDDEDLDFQDEEDVELVDVNRQNTLQDIAFSVENLDLEDKDAAGMTKLHHAVLDGDLLLVTSLVERGANIRSKSNDGKTALHYACRSRHGDNSGKILTLLLESVPEEVKDLADENGQTPIHYAAQRGLLREVELLIDHGASTADLDLNGLSPFLWAVIAGEHETASQMLSRGADVNSADADGKSAIWWAANQGHSTITKLLLDNGADANSTTMAKSLTPLLEAAACGDGLSVKVLLKFGANVKHADSNGKTALHWAAEGGHAEIVALLLNHGVEPNATNASGITPMHCAAFGGDSETMDFLIQEYGNPLAMTDVGWTPLHYAAFMGHSNVTRSLLEAGAASAIALQDNDGSTLR